jgi:hypothetical protein
VREVRANSERGLGTTNSEEPTEPAAFSTPDYLLDEARAFASPLTKASQLLVGAACEFLGENQQNCAFLARHLPQVPGTASKVTELLSLGRPKLFPLLPVQLPLGVPCRRKTKRTSEPLMPEQIYLAFRQSEPCGRFQRRRRRTDRDLYVSSISLCANPFAVLNCFSRSPMSISVGSHEP